VPEEGSDLIESEAPRENIVQVYPRRIDLENVVKLSSFEHTTIAESFSGLCEAVSMRLAEVQP
jgi:hypothetical protein